MLYCTPTLTYKRCRLCSKWNLSLTSRNFEMGCGGYMLLLCNNRSNGHWLLSRKWGNKWQKKKFRPTFRSREKEILWYFVTSSRTLIYDGLGDLETSKTCSIAVSNFSFKCKIYFLEVRNLWAECQLNPRWAKLQCKKSSMTNENSTN